MAVYLRVEGGFSVERFTPPVELCGYGFRDYFHPSLHWIEVTSLVPMPDVGWQYVNGVFTPFDPLEHPR